MKNIFIFTWVGSREFNYVNLRENFSHSCVFNEKTTIREKIKHKKFYFWTISFLSLINSRSKSYQKASYTWNHDLLHEKIKNISFMYTTTELCYSNLLNSYSFLSNLFKCKNVIVHCNFHHWHVSKVYNI